MQATRTRRIAAPLFAVLLTLVVILGTTAGAHRVGSARAAAGHPGKEHGAAPLIFGHRGAAGYRPEHTLASYDLAVRMGADVIEPDLVSTKDHVLVARHENDITATTDVAGHPEFAGRRTTKTVDGIAETGWFTEDFTLSELKTLRAKERLPDVRQENTIFNGRYQIPTFQEVVDLAKRESVIHHRRIGIAPETKHPTYFDSIGLSLEEPLVAALRSNGLDNRDSRVYLQSFEEANLRELHSRFHLRVHLLQLTSAGPTARPYDHVVSGDPRTYADMTTPAGLKEISTYADVLGPDKEQIFTRDPAGNTGAPTTLITDAHAANLAVVTYTIRAENQFLPLQYRSSADPNAFGNMFGELHDLFAAGIDGFFTDQSDIGFAAREDFLGFTYGVEHPQAKAA
ncbi:MAG: glycerophosphodiester phosphodiesterase [Pseudonocardiales bacterium]|nr:MAG: glycerophosphodiester phosphodiesterase [Pseudonocardiales bacterium]